MNLDYSLLRRSLLLEFSQIGSPPASSCAAVWIVAEVRRSCRQTWGRPWARWWGPPCWDSGCYLRLGQQAASWSLADLLPLMDVGRSRWQHWIEWERHHTAEVKRKRGRNKHYATLVDMRTKATGKEQPGTDKQEPCSSKESDWTHLACIQGLLQVGFSSVTSVRLNGNKDTEQAWATKLTFINFLDVIKICHVLWQIPCFT